MINNPSGMYSNASCNFKEYYNNKMKWNDINGRTLKERKQVIQRKTCMHQSYHSIANGKERMFIIQERNTKYTKERKLLRTIIHNEKRQETRACSLDTSSLTQWLYNVKQVMEWYVIKICHKSAGNSCTRKSNLRFFFSSWCEGCQYVL